jgi:hypothetical protein
LWLVRALQQLSPDGRPGVFEVLAGLGNVQTINTGGTLVCLHAFPCALHILPRERLQQQASPCALQLLSRETGFIAGRSGQGFTLTVHGPPR